MSADPITTTDPYAPISIRALARIVRMDRGTLAKLPITFTVDGCARPKTTVALWRAYVNRKNQEAVDAADNQ